jgi:hypothetical protein
MTSARNTQLACCLMATAALTACGGGGEKGPAWAQANTANLQRVIPYVKAAPAYLSECKAVGSSSLSFRKGVIVVSETSSTIIHQPVIRYYQSTDCADTTRIFTLVEQLDTLSVDGASTDDISGETVQKVTHNIATGEIKVTVDADGISVAPTPGDEANSLDIAIKDGPTFSLTRIQQGDSYHDIILIKDGFLYFGDLTPVEADPNTYPTQIDLNNDIYEYTVI